MHHWNLSLVTVGSLPEAKFKMRHIPLQPPTANLDQDTENACSPQKQISIKQEDFPLTRFDKCWT